MIRRIGEPPYRGVKYQYRAGVYAILPRNGGLLVTHQSQPEPELQLPGGGIDPGESPLQALHREVFEETGWSITAPLRLGVFRRFVFMPDYDIWAEKVCTIFVARPARQIAAPTEPHHIAMTVDVGFAIEELGNEGDRMFVSQWAGLT